MVRAGELVRDKLILTIPQITKNNKSHRLASINFLIYPRLEALRLRGGTSQHI
jgi:hypothetical protein